MYYVVFAKDDPSKYDTRVLVRSEHRKHLREHNFPVQVMLGGPMLDEKTGRMNGTMLVIRAADERVIREYLNEDPYVKSGVFLSLDVCPWVCGLGILKE